MFSFQAENGQYYVKALKCAYFSISNLIQETEKTKTKKPQVFSQHVKFAKLKHVNTNRCEYANPVLFMTNLHSSKNRRENYLKL